MTVSESENYFDYMLEQPDEDMPDLPDPSYMTLLNFN